MKASRMRPMVFVLLLAACSADSCPDGQLECDGRCIGVSNDPLNCGGCGVHCLGDQQCSAGGCGCPAGTVSCGVACVVLSDDDAHCGTCNRACPSGASCMAGTCGCPGDAVLCDGACVSLESDADNCGACGIACTAEQVCTQGQCRCNDPQRRDCGGACVLTDSDARHCGSCGSVCAAPRSCRDGVCSCEAGTTFCDGACVDLSQDRAHCGRCGNACSGDAACVDARCVPELQWADSHAGPGRMSFGIRDWDARVAVAEDGAVYLGYSVPDADVTLVAYSPSGALRWTRTMDTRASRVGDVAVVDGGVVLTASYWGSWSTPGGRFVGSGGSTDVAVVAFDESGDTRWDYFVQSEGVERTGGLGAGGGLVSVGGSLGGTYDFGGGALTGDTYRDAFVLLLDAATGAYENAVVGAGPGTIRPVFAEVADDGDVLVAGYAGAGVSFGGAPRTSTVTGGFVARLAPDLSHRWSRRVLADDIHGLAVDSAGDVYVSGRIERTTDWGGGASLMVASSEHATFVLAVNGRTGESRWASGVTGRSVELGRGPVVDGAGRVWFGASTSGRLGGTDAVLTALAPADGRTLVGHTLGSEQNDLFCGIAANGNHLAVGGRFWGTARFGSSTFTASEFDVFVAQLSL